ASAFSSLDGASTPEDLVKTCRNFGMPAMALLDRGGVYGAARFHQAAKKASLQAHIGAEFGMESEPRIPLLAATRHGYQNLCRSITQMKQGATADIAP